MKEEGPRALYKGIVPGLVLVSHSLTFLLLLQIVSYFGRVWSWFSFFSRFLMVLFSSQRMRNSVKSLSIWKRREENPNPHLIIYWYRLLLLLLTLWLFGNVGGPSHLFWHFFLFFICRTRRIMLHWEAPPKSQQFFLHILFKLLEHDYR